jgi:flagellar protein FlaG
MTGEINSLMQNLQPSSRELSGQEVSRVTGGQGIAAAEPVNGKRAPDPAGEKDKRAEDAQKPDQETLRGTVSDLNMLVQQMRRELRFTVDEDSGEMVVKVIDKETDEVLRQIPSEELLALRKRMADVAGVIFSDSV